MDETTLTVVGDEMEAEMICGLLRANGIECFHRRTDPASAISAFAVGNSMAGPTEIVVNERDLEAARKLLPEP